MKKIHKSNSADYSDIIGALGINEEDYDIKLDCDLQLERERKTAREFPEFYRLADMMETREGMAYRSGEGYGERYMTNEDLNRIILEKTRIPKYVMAGAPTEEVRRPAAVYNVRGCGRATIGAGIAASVCENVFDDQGYAVERVEGSDTDLRGAVARIIDQWFPAHNYEKLSRMHRRHHGGSAAAGVAWAVILALVLALPITLGVLKSDAIATLNAKQDELYALEKTEADLKAEFESSLDLREIEDVAVNEIGMIKLNDSTIRLLRLNDIDSIESFSDKKSNSVVPALLSALGIHTAEE